jgi:DNA-binding NtrC family response regulator
VIERAVVLCAKPVIDLEDLALPIRDANTPPHSGGKEPPSSKTNQLAQARGSAEITRLREALHRHNNNRTHAASELGVSRVTLLKKLRQYGLT